MEKIARRVRRRQRSFVPQMASRLKVILFLLYLCGISSVSDCVIGSNQVQLTDDSCKATVNENGTAILSTELNECGTTAFHKGDCIMFSVCHPKSLDGSNLH